MSLEVLAFEVAFISPSLLTDFRRELASVSLARDLRLSQTCYGYACSMLLAPSCDRILKLVCLLLILQSQAMCFPESGAKLWSLPGPQIQSH